MRTGAVFGRHGPGACTMLWAALVLSQRQRMSGNKQEWQCLLVAESLCGLQLLSEGNNGLHFCACVAQMSHADM